MRAEPAERDLVGGIRELQGQREILSEARGAIREEVGGDARNVAKRARPPARLAIMSRRVVIGIVVIALFVAAGAAFALWADDDSTDTAVSTTTTTVATSSTTAPVTTTAPATTAPTTTAPPAAVDACGAEQAAITAAIDNGVSGARDRAQVEECRLAAVDPSWAAVRLVARPGATFTAATVVVRGGGGAWAVVGTDTSACGSTPQQVLVDLGILCLSGGGGGT